MHSDFQHVRPIATRLTGSTHNAPARPQDEAQERLELQLRRLVALLRAAQDIELGVDVDVYTCVDE